MKIQITIEEKDADLIGGFCLATGWTAGSGQKQNDWCASKISSWIGQRARIGATMLSTTKVRDDYAAVLRSASESSKSIPDPQVGVSGAAIVG